MQRIQDLPSDRKGYQSLCFPMFPAVVSIPTVGTLLMLFWLNHYLSLQWYRVSTIFNVFLYILDIMCYIQAIVITNSPIPSRPPKQGPLPPWISASYRRDNRCQKQSQQQWKPPRTSHCHICGCVLRMDHHCVWINQCVGAKNHRAFFLFVVYSFVIAAQYLLLSVNFYFFHFEELNVVLNVLWLSWVGVGLFLVCGLGSLGMMQIVMIANNQTQLEMMKIGGNPLLRSPGNIYDMGGIANYVDFFQGDTFFWWLPKARNPPFDGCDYIKIPQVTRQQLQKLTAQQKESLKWGCQYKTFNQAVSAAYEKYSQKVFSFQNQLYRYQDLPSYKDMA